VERTAYGAEISESVATAVLEVTRQYTERAAAAHSSTSESSASKTLSSGSEHKLSSAGINRRDRCDTLLEGTTDFDALANLAVGCAQLLPSCQQATMFAGAQLYKNAILRDMLALPVSAALLAALPPATSFVHPLPDDGEMGTIPDEASTCQVDGTGRDLRLPDFSPPHFP
jgi:hypothetical protein